MCNPPVKTMNVSQHPIRRASFVGLSNTITKYYEGWENEIYRGFKSWFRFVFFYCLNIYLNYPYKYKVYYFLAYFSFDY